MTTNIAISTLIKYTNRGSIEISMISNSDQSTIRLQVGHISNELDVNKI